MSVSLLVNDIINRPDNKGNLLIKYQYQNL